MIPEPTEAELTDAEIDSLLERFDQTEPRLQRRIIVAFMCKAESAERERDKLQAFKDWTHTYLDSHGVPHHPPGTHGAEGCRIGDRMDWLMDQLESAVAEGSRFREVIRQAVLEKLEVAGCVRYGEYPDDGVPYAPPSVLPNIPDLEDQLAAARAEVERLTLAIRTHREQKADDRCIEDDDRLYAALGDGVKCDRRVGDKDAMLRNCQRFIERRCEGGGWPTYAELEAEVERLRTRLAEVERDRDALLKHTSDRIEVREGR